MNELLGTFPEKCANIAGRHAISVWDVCHEFYTNFVTIMVNKNCFIFFYFFVRVEVNKQKSHRFLSIFKKNDTTFIL